MTDNYTRLPGTGKDFEAGAFTTKFTLWLGQDHLLSVTDTGFHETYKRFYFKDIQAIIVCKTLRGTVWSVLLGFLSLDALALALMGILSHWSMTAIVLLSALGGILSLCFAANLIHGATCRTSIRTAVQVEPLRSLNRLRTAMKVTAILRQRIEEAQGILAAEDMQQLQEIERARQQAASEKTAPAPTQAAQPAVEARPRKHYGGRAHFVLFLFLIVDLYDTCVDFFFPFEMTLLSIVLFIGVPTAIIVALVKQNNSDIPLTIKTITWCSLAYVVVGLLFVSVFGVVCVVVDPLSGGGLPSPRESPVMALFLAFSAFTAGGLAFTGLFELNRFRKQSVTPPEIRDGGEEVRGQGSEVGGLPRVQRDQRPEDRGQESGIS